MHGMVVSRIWLPFFFVVAFCMYLAVATDFSISFAKASFKVSTIRDGEKIHRVWVATESDKLSDIAKPEGFEVGNANSISVQAAFEKEDGKPAFVHQLFLRFVNQRTNQDNLFLVKRGSRDMRSEINLKNEIKGDAVFWEKDDSYAVELVMGDKLLKEGVAWRITDNMRFADDASAMFQRPARGVFDFDVGVKKDLLPEFISPVPSSEKRASLFAIVLALISTLLPLPVLLVVWANLGVFPLQLPTDSKQKVAVLGFQACLLAHSGALVMFWLKWNIVTTWKFMGAIMVPTLLLGKVALSDDKKA